MWFDGIRQPNTIYVASCSRGKDSTAMLRAIQLMDWPLDMIVAVDIWATDTIPAELPPMSAFKDDYDAKVLALFGIPVTRLCLLNSFNSPITFEYLFYHRSESHWGFPMLTRPWCRKLKLSALSDNNIRSAFLSGIETEFVHMCGQRFNIVQYVGIAADEPLRIARHISHPKKIFPLVQIGWDENLCGLETTYMDMLSPSYVSACRDGCWFCHCQSVNSLRSLRKNFPDLWSLLLKWDTDSPVSFRADGKTVRDFDTRFQAEDLHMVPSDSTFRWSMLTDYCQLSLFF